MTLHSFCFETLGSEDFFSSIKRIPRPLLTASKSTLLGFEAAPLLSDLDNKNYRNDVYKNDTTKTEAIRAMETAWARDQTDMPNSGKTKAEKQFERDVEDWLRFHKAMLIGELIPLTLRYLRHNPHAPEKTRYEHILVDEYQDLNKAEQVLIDLLSEENSCMVVGDVDQSIYSFRHAKPDGMKDYNARHPQTVKETLEECRRCPTSVVSMACDLIERNYNEECEKLKPSPGKEVGFVHHRQWMTLDDQVKGAVAYVHWLRDTYHISEGDILVLSPSRKIGYAIRDQLREEGIAAQSYFHEEALEEPETQKAFTLLALLADSNDRVALRYWLGLGSETHNRREYQLLRAMCEPTNTEPMIALQQLKQSTGGAKFPKLLERFDSLQSALQELKNKRGKALLDVLFPSTSEWAQDIRLLAGETLPDEIGAVELHKKLREQIAQPSLPMDVQFVRIMSLHKAKGLTARAVALVGCVNGLIPRDWKPEKSVFSNNRDHEQEQRRVFYVALTRTTEHLLISSFRKAPKSLARKMNMPVGLEDGADFAYHASYFLQHLGNDLPDATTSMVFD